MIKLYHCGSSYASQKVRLYLAEKNISFESKHIDLRKQEHITSDYRKINPLGTVPAMIDEKGMVVCGSTTIMEYLEAYHQHPPLLPTNAEACRLIHAVCMEHEQLHDPSLRLLSYHVLFMGDNKRKTLDSAYIADLADKHPNKSRGIFLRRAIQGEFTQDEIDQAKQAVNEALSRWDKRLKCSGGDFLVGQAYSMADAVCTASAYRIAQVKMEEELENHRFIKRWYEHMKERDSFKVAILDYLSP